MGWADHSAPQVSSWRRDSRAAVTLPINDALEKGASRDTRLSPTRARLMFPHDPPNASSPMSHPPPTALATTRLRLFVRPAPMTRARASQASWSVLDSLFHQHKSPLPTQALAATPLGLATKDRNDVPNYMYPAHRRCIKSMYRHLIPILSQLVRTGTLLRLPLLTRHAGG